MIKEIVSYLIQRIEASELITDVKGMATKVEREGAVFPAIFNNNEFTRIDFDKFSSVSYFRLNGEPSYSSEESKTKIGMDYSTTIPLKLVVFIKKNNDSDAYFTESVIQTLIATLTNNSVALKQQLKAKNVRISVRTFSQDNVINGEYTNIVFEPRYAYSLFSIDLDCLVVSNQNCFVGICDDFADLKCGSVTIKNGSGDIIATIDCGGEYVCTGGGTVTVHNSDDSFTSTIDCGDSLLLEDITFNINVNGTLVSTFTQVNNVDLTINITAP